MGAAGQPRFGIFEITPSASWSRSPELHLMLFSGRLIDQSERQAEPEASSTGTTQGGGQVGDASAFATVRPLRPYGRWFRQACSLR